MNRSSSKTKFHIVSIHAPNEGSDVRGLVLVNLQTVSIHAPNEGSDFVECGDRSF